MRKMLSTLANQGNQVKLKEAFHVDVTDALGNMRPLLSILMDLEQATSQLTSTDQISVFFDLFGERAANAAILLGKSGDAVVDFRQKMMNSLGSSEQMAKTMTDTLYGDFIALTSAVEGTQIAVGEALGDMSRSVLQFATGNVRGIAIFISENQKLVQALAVSAVAVGSFGAISLAVGVGTPFFFGVIQNIERATAKLSIFKNAVASVKTMDSVTVPVQAGPSRIDTLREKVQQRYSPVVAATTGKISNIDKQLESLGTQSLTNEKAFIQKRDAINATILKNREKIAEISRRESQSAAALSNSLLSGNTKGMQAAEATREKLKARRLILEARAATLTEQQNAVSQTLASASTSNDAEIAKLKAKRAGLERA
jgi:hypothetical protein